MMDIHYWHLVGILVFLFGQYNQYVAHSKLASFRKGTNKCFLVKKYEIEMLIDF